MKKKSLKQQFEKICKYKRTMNEIPKHRGMNNPRWLDIPLKSKSLFSSLTITLREASMDYFKRCTFFH